MKVFLILLAVFGFSMPACAFNCFELDTREGVQICLKHELESEDQMLNQHYSEVSELVSGDDKLRLRKEQIEWIIKRNDYCQIDPRLSNDPQWIEKLSSQFSKAICTSNLTKLRNTELGKVANNHRLRLHKELVSFPRVESPWQAAYLAGWTSPVSVDT